jgi:ribosomal-protein-alanine N-acetyltransferase
MASDIANLTSLFADPEVTAGIGSGKPRTEQQIAELLSFFLDHYQKYSFGPMAVVLKETDRVIGINGLKYLRDFEHADLGFAFLKSHWGMGFATETCLKVIEFGIQKYQLRVIGAHVSSENNSDSINVLRKIGMRYDRSILRNAVASDVYLLEYSDQR